MIGGGDVWGYSNRWSSGSFTERRYIATGQPALEESPISWRRSSNGSASTQPLASPSAIASGRKDLMVQHAGVGRDGEEVLEVRCLDQLAGEEGGVLIGLIARGRVGLFGAGEFGVDYLIA